MVGEQFTQQPFEEKKSNWKLWLFIGLGVVILIIGTIYFFLGFDTSNIGSTSENPEQEQTQTSEVTLDENCDAFPSNLDSCTKYKCQFIHPFTGELMVKEILGITENKCGYVEEMPNNGEMNCKYSEDMRKATSQHYKDLESAESTSTEIKINGSLSSPDVKVKFTIDGKEVENPLQEALDNGQCVISGY